MFCTAFLRKNKNICEKYVNTLDKRKKMATIVIVSTQAMRVLIQNTNYFRGDKYDNQTTCRQSSFKIC